VVNEIRILVLAAGAVVGASAADVVDGRVTDLAGKPLGGVVVAAQTWERKKLGDATTGADGRFKIRCPATAPDVTLIVEHAGFQRYAMSGFKTGGGAAAIALTRVIDADYLAAIARETDPTRFRARAADLLAPSQGSTGEALPLEVVVPALPALRKPLRAWLPADAAALRRKDLPRDQDFALRLLTLLGDPADDDLVEAWIAGDPKRAARPPRRAGRSRSTHPCTPGQTRTSRRKAIARTSSDRTTAARPSRRMAPATPSSR
jgi:hypothetical protein